MWIFFTVSDSDFCFFNYVVKSLDPCNIVLTMEKTCSREKNLMK